MNLFITSSKNLFLLFILFILRTLCDVALGWMKKLGLLICQTFFWRLPSMMDSAYEYCKFRDDWEIVRLLLNHGADVNGQGWTARGRNTERQLLYRWTPN